MRREGEEKERKERKESRGITIDGTIWSTNIGNDA